MRRVVSGKTRDEASHRGGVCSRGRGKTGDEAGAVGGGAILADLPFTGEACHGNFEADDGVQAFRDEVGRRIVDGPRGGTRRFVALREARDLSEEPRGVVADDERTVGVNRAVVPSRDDLAVLRLRGDIPGRRDLGLRALENDEDCGRAGVIVPEGIGAGDVGEECAVGRGGGGSGIEFERDRIRIEAGGAEGDERAERVGGDEVVEDGGAGFGEMSGRIHAALERRTSGAGERLF